LELLEQGVRVFHDSHGSGEIVLIDVEDARRKPYRVLFDSGEVHSYSATSAAKLRVMATSKALGVGARMLHDEHGSGYIAEVNLNEKRGKPYRVRFDSGEVHAYSLSSALKLRVKRDIPIPATTIDPARGPVDVATEAELPLNAQGTIACDEPAVSPARQRSFQAAQDTPSMALRLRITFAGAILSDGAASSIKYYQPTKHRAVIHSKNLLLAR
jgi:hypothetical protein